MFDGNDSVYFSRYFYQTLIVPVPNCGGILKLDLTIDLYKVMKASCE